MKLGVFTYNHGLPHNSFIRKYCEDLSNKTIVFSPNIKDSNWSSDNLVPLNYKNKLDPSLIIERVTNILSNKNENKNLWSYKSKYRSELIKKISESQITHLFTQYINHAIHIDPVCKELGIKHIARGHGYDISQIPQTDWGKRYYSLANKLDAIIVPTQHQVNTLQKNGITRPQLSAHVCGTTIPELNPYKTSKQNKIRIISVGRFVEKKSPLTTIKSFLKASKTLENIELVMIGDGTLLKKCQEYVNTHNANHKITFLGSINQADVILEMQKSDLFIQHSVTAKNGDQEGAPVAISEALSNGLPVIATEHSGIPYIVNQKSTGILVKEYDLDAMTEAIINLSTDYDKRLTMSSAAFKFAKSELSWEQEKAHLLEIIKNC